MSPASAKAASILAETASRESAEPERASSMAESADPRASSAERTPEAAWESAWGMEAPSGAVVSRSPWAPESSDEAEPTREA